MNTLKNYFNNIYRLRLEEVIALLFLIPSLLITIKANWFFLDAGSSIPRKIQGGIPRIIVTVTLMIAFLYFVKKKPFWKYTYWLRDVMPFVFCIGIYTNLHDTIHFVNPHDIHDYLIKIDEAMFGVQPVLWIQHFYRPWLTDYFSISYMNYFFIVVSVVVYLLVTKRTKEMRTVLFGTILCFYFGYFLYIAFPAAPPRLVLADQFIRDFGGGWLGAAQMKMVSISSSSSRAAFPSLHCAITLISLMYSWNMARKLFWILLIPGISLVIATVYLRHHFVIDILAGFALAIFAYFVAPHIDAWWSRLSEKHRPQKAIESTQETT